MVNQMINKSFDKPIPCVWLGDGSRGFIVEIRRNEKNNANVFWCKSDGKSGIKKLFWKPNKADVMKTLNVPYTLINILELESGKKTAVITTKSSGRNYLRLDYLSLSNPHHKKMQKALLECQREIDVAQSNLKFIVDKMKHIKNTDKLDKFADGVADLSTKLRDLNKNIKDFEVPLKDLR